MLHSVCSGCESCSDAFIRFLARCLTTRSAIRQTTAVTPSATLTLIAILVDVDSAPEASPLLVPFKDGVGLASIVADLRVLLVVDVTSGWDVVGKGTDVVKPDSYCNHACTMLGVVMYEIATPVRGGSIAVAGKFVPAVMTAIPVSEQVQFSGSPPTKG